MANERAFTIERFFYGNLFQDNQPIGTPTVIAQSPGITPDHVATALKIGRVKPPSVDDTSDELPSSLGLVRGDTGEYIVVKSQRNAAGYPQLSYFFVPDMAIRWLGGNYTLFESLGFQESRVLESTRSLQPLTLDNPQTFTDEEQVELLYDLYYFAGDETKTVEALVAALINSQPILIVNASPSLKDRMGFIYGMLCMLPAPARVGMTWLTHTDSIKQSPAQINFATHVHDVPAGYLVYDWANGELVTEPIGDKYSKFIASQMRLDASLVVENTTNIARTAVWRAMRNDSLAEALHFASRRASVDSAVSNNQPADRETVAGILRQDPTLSDEMRLRYAQHLLAFTIALGDALEHADVIPVVAAADRPVAEMAYRLLRDEAEGENPLKVIDIVERWLVHVPQASVLPWNQLAYIAAVTELENLLDVGNTFGAIGLLERVQQSSRALQMENVVGQLVTLAQPAAAYNDRLSMAIFMLTAEYAPIEAFGQLIQDTQLVSQLPVSLQHAIYHLQPQPRPDPTRNLLVSVVSDLEAQHRMLVIGRLAELAVFLQREYLIDTRILEGLLRASQSGYAWRFAELIQYLAEQYTQPAKLRELDRAALELLPHLYFSTGRYEIGVQLLEHYQKNIYGTQNLEAFTESIGNIFLSANFSIDVLEKIFAIIEHSQLRPQPRVRALAATLIASEWGIAYKNLARRLTIMLYNDNDLLVVIGLENSLQLLDYHINAKDEVSVAETCSLLLNVATQMDKKGVDIILKIWNRLVEYYEYKDLALDVLRDYVRMAPASMAHQLPTFFAKRIAPQIGSMLQATYVMRRVMNGRDMLAFVEAIGMTANFLKDVYLPYSDPEWVPGRWTLKRDLNSLTGGLDDRQRNLIGQANLSLAQSLFVLERQQSNQHKRNRQAVEAALLKNATAPTTSLDLIIFIAGFFSRGKASRVELATSEVPHIYGQRSAIILKEEIPIVAGLLDDILNSFSDDSPVGKGYITLEPDMLRKELQNLWGQISLYNQRQSQETLANATQHLSQLVPIMTAEVKDRVFQNRELFNGQDKPENSIEALIWISGYYHKKHID